MKKRTTTSQIMQHEFMGISATREKGARQRKNTRHLKSRRNIRERGQTDGTDVSKRHSASVAIVPIAGENGKEKARTISALIDSPQCVAREKASASARSKPNVARRPD
jgi:hypothetical protein